MELIASTDPTLDRVLERAVAGERLNLEEGIGLFSCDLLSLGKAATLVRDRLHPSGIITFIVDRNVSYTNACFVDCDFCAFYRRPRDPEAYTLTLDQIFDKIQELVDLGGTQVLIQGGVNPDLGLDFYLNMIRQVHARFPQVHIHSLSVVEIDFIAKKEKMPLREVLIQLKEAGLNSIPGGGAEILVERVRKLISPKKIDSDGWLDFHRVAHGLGLRSTATMVFGHVETIEERVIHLERLRSLQDETGGFRAFIPWTLSPHGTPRMSQFEPAGGTDYLKTLAVSRLFLDNILNIQSGWLTEGLKMGQVGLAFGANDIGGTLIEDKVLEPTGIEVKTRPEDLIRLIQEAGYTPAQRNTNYEILKVFS
ncbi:MAG: dehypoxanthine futalosine cyclase [Candidatus Omnitrophica bacterium]|nr:dehypoxanthine futalosine cyclase [Candidatus Omnitrophota bacterium]